MANLDRLDTLPAGPVNWELNNLTSTVTGLQPA